jgi:uncharacterized protein YycO
VSVYTPGDCFLYHGSGLIDRIIQRGTRSWWNHCGLIVTADGGIIEALSTGVALNNLIAYPPTAYTVLSPPLDAEQRAHAVAYARGRIGDRYDRLTIAGLALNRLTGLRLTLAVAGEDVCSGLIGEAYERAGLDLGGDGAGLTPADLARLLHAPRP